MRLKSHCILNDKGLKNGKYLWLSSFVTNAKYNIFSSPKVTSSHQSKLSETENELKELEEKISRYSVVIRPAKKDDCVLPEDERTEVVPPLIAVTHYPKIYYR